MILKHHPLPWSGNLYHIIPEASSHLIYLLLLQPDLTAYTQSTENGHRTGYERKTYQSSHKNIVHSNMQMVSYVYIYSSISVCAIVLSYTCFVTVGYGKRRPPTKGSSHKGLKQDMHIMPVYLMATDFNAVMWGWYSCQEVLGLLWCIITQ